MKLSKTERLMAATEAEARQTPIQRALTRGGLRVASTTDTDRLTQAGTLIHGARDLSKHKVLYPLVNHRAKVYAILGLSPRERPRPKLQFVSSDGVNCTVLFRDTEYSIPEKWLGIDPSSRTAGLASRFMRPRSMPVLQPSATHHATHPAPVLAHVCPRCNQPTETVRLANSTTVQYCVHGCRYVVPLPTSNLTKE